MAENAPLRWLGRRGAVLLLFGVGFVAYGVRIVAEPVPVDPDRALLHLMTPASVRAGAWITVGAIAGLTPFVIKATGRATVQRVLHRISPRLAQAASTETAGFSLAVLPPLFTAISYLLAWIAYLLPLHIVGDPGGWGSAAIWVVLAGVLMIVAGWRENARLPSTGGDV